MEYEHSNGFGRGKLTRSIEGCVLLSGTNIISSADVLHITFIFHFENVPHPPLQSAKISKFERIVS